jgi:plastocyanin
VRILRYLLIAAAAVLILSACGGSDDEGTEAGAAPTTVAIKDFKFEPKAVTVSKGQSVRWENGDAFLHTVTSGDTSGETNAPDGRFDKGLPDSGTSASVRFDEPGTYSYYCKQHNAMNGTITVR